VTDKFELVIRYPLEDLIPFYAGNYKLGDVLTVSVEGRVISQVRVVDISGDVVYFEKVDAPA
jgi:hypothetical protein